MASGPTMDERWVGPQRLPVPKIPRITPFRIVCVVFDPRTCSIGDFCVARDVRVRAGGLLEQPLVLLLRLALFGGLGLVDRGLLLGELGVGLRLRDRGLGCRLRLVGGVHLRGEDLAGRLTVDRRAVLRQQGGCLHRRLDLGIGCRRHQALRRPQPRPRDRRRSALLAHHRDDRLAGAELLQHALQVVARFRVRPHGRAQSLRVVWRECAEGMLHARAELRENVRRNVLRGLGDEEDSDALGADEPHRLDDRREEVLRRVLEEQVRLVEEEHQLRLIGVADLGEDLEQLRQQVHEERGEQRRLVDDSRHLEQADDPASVRRDAQEVGHFELGLAEEDVGALVGEGDELAEDDSRGGGGEPAEVLELRLALVAGQVGEHGPQVRQIDQRESVRIGVVEHETEARLLRLIEAEHLAQQQRPEPRHRRPYRNALADPAQREVLGDGCCGLPVLTDSAGPCQKLLTRLAGSGDTREVALDVGGEDRDALGGQLLRETLQGARLAGAGRAGDEAVPVHHGERDADLRRRQRLAVDESTEIERRRLERVALDDRGDLVGVERTAGRFDSGRRPRRRTGIRRQFRRFGGFREFRRGIGLSRRIRLIWRRGDGCGCRGARGLVWRRDRLRRLRRRGRGFRGGERRPGLRRLQLRLRRFRLGSEPGKLCLGCGYGGIDRL